MSTARNRPAKYQVRLAKRSLSGYEPMTREFMYRE
jgi:hypothetical protein